jgi:hypothetical protein
MNNDMDENPYQSRETPHQAAEGEATASDRAWHPVTCALVGFSLGTAAVSPLILSLDPVARLIGGAMFGGVPGAMFGFGHGALRQRKRRPTGST